MMQEIQAVLEAVLFAAGDSVSVVRLSKVLGVDMDEILHAAAALEQDYAERKAGIRLIRMDDRLQMITAAEHSDVIERVLEKRTPPKLSPTALEVLSIVAYYQPVTRAYIEKLRGTDSSYTVTLLLERGLIRPVGRLEAPGRPVLFGTTEHFLRVLGLSSLSELPPLPNVATDEGLQELQNTIDSSAADAVQLEIRIEE